MKKFIFIFPALLIMLGTVAQKNVEFDPIPCSDLANAKETINKVYRSQRAKEAPNELEITDKYIAWSKQKSKSGYWTYSRGTVTLSNTVYYDMISELRLIRYKKHYEIIIISKSTKTKYKIILWDKELAIEGYSAIKCMIEQTKKK